MDQPSADQEMVISGENLEVLCVCSLVGADVGVQRCLGISAASSSVFINLSYRIRSNKTHFKTENCFKNSAEELQGSWNFTSAPVLQFKLTAFKQFKY